MADRSPAGAEPPASGGDRERTMAALSYLLTWLTGLIVFVVAEDDDRFARWHAIQSIGLGLGLALASTLVGVTGAIVAVVAMLVAGAGHGGGRPAFVATVIVGAAVLAILVQIVAFVLVIVLAVKAYRGQRPRLPVIAGFADDLA